MNKNLIQHFKLVTARQVDKPYAKKLHYRCYYDVVCKQFGGWDVQLQNSFFEQQWNPQHYQLVFYKESKADLISVIQNADYIGLNEIQIDPRLQRKGLGAALINNVIGQAKKQSLPLRLQVLLLSPAENLYRRLGFAVTGETATHKLMEYDFKF